MTTELLAAIVDAIKTGYWDHYQLSLLEFEAINDAVAIAKRKMAIEWLAGEQKALREHVMEVAARIR